MPFRETFWNIPHWAEIAQYILGLLTVAVFTYGVIRRVNRWRQGQPEKRSGHVWKRLWSLFTQAILQMRTAQGAYAGIMHLTIFWGILVLLIGTVLATIDWDVTRLFFGFQFLTGGLYIAYELVLDVFGILLILGLGMAIHRRFLLRPQKLQNPLPALNLDDTYVLVMLTLIAISGFLTEGLRIAVTRPAWADWSPLGKAISSLFIASGDPTNQVLHLVLWTFHLLTAFGLLASLPYTKLFHILAVPANIYFRSLAPAGTLSPMRSGNGIGVREWRQFSWKQLLDFDSCTRCGRCQEVCPAHAAGGVLSPRNLMIKLAAHLWSKNDGRALAGDVILQEELWACATCRACTQICPAFIDHVASIVDMRRYLVDQGAMDPTLQTALANLGRYGNSFGQSDRARAKWAMNQNPAIKDARREEVEYLWFVGDYASYSPTLTEITRKTAEVFGRLGMDFGILYDSEINSGNDVRRIGEEGIFEMLSEKNRQALGRSKYQSIVTSDPHSYNTLKNEYSFNGNGRPEIYHYVELLDRWITSGRLQFSRKLDYRVTYHDPCYLGRYNGVYDAPRRVLRAMGCQLVEMPRHGDRAFCCGAGGGHIWMEEKQVKERPSESRVQEAAALPGTQSLVVACPKDVTMFRDAVKTTGNENRLNVRELIELVHEAM